MYKYNLDKTFKLDDVKNHRIEWLKKEILKIKIMKQITYKQLILFSTKLYEKGYSGLDLIQLIENNNIFTNLSEKKKYELLFAFNKVRKELRNENLLIMFIMNFLFLSLDCSLENISFM